MATPRYQQRMVGYGSHNAFRPKKRRQTRSSRNTSSFSLGGMKLPRFGNFGIGKKTIAIILGLFGIIGLGAFGRFWTQIVQKLPDINQIQDFNFKQATTITDRNGVVLYRMFEENRQYVSYAEISPHFVNGLVATEDQRFWDNAGIDPMGMMRAAFTDVTQGKTHGASTLTQQLIKMMMLTPEKKIERKLKEIILAVKISGYIKKEIAASTKGLSDQEIDKQVKEKIMELYSNLIFLGNNAYGVEAAAQTYFNTKAKDLTILQGAILAGLPQAPSRYDPYGNKGIVMGKFLITNKAGEEVDATDGLLGQAHGKAEAIINESKLENKKNDQALLDFLISALSTKVDDGVGGTYTVTYEPGRKDVVLARMFEEGYITEFELKKALIEGLNYQFEHGKVSIKAPHFVFWIIEQLKQNYDQETLQKGGLTVTTSLDYTIQEMAEQSILDNKDRLATNQANNSSLLYTDSKNGDVIAYVGSIDYNNAEIEGQVDMVQALRQPGSTIKPLIYSLGFMKLPLSIDSPIYDIKMKIDQDEPNNVDGKFGGLTTIKQALAGSRNIPAIKMFFGAGGEGAVKGFLGDLGITNLTEGNKFYGYPLAIGAAEMKMIDLTNAYMHLSAMGKPAKLNPILEIRGQNNNLLYKKEVEMQKEVIPAGVAYLLRSILSNPANMPSGWVRQFTPPGKLVMATKSGTTNIVKGEGENAEKLPRDGWLMSYTPSKVIALRGGNTNGAPMHKDAYGGWLNSGIWQSFLDKLTKNGYLQNETSQPVDVKEIVISKISGKLASNDTPPGLAVKSLARVQNAPSAYDTSIKKMQIDGLCNGEPGELTPQSDITTAWVISPETFMPDKRDSDDVRAWRESVGIGIYTPIIGPMVLKGAGANSINCSDLRATITGDATLTIIKPTNGEKVTRSFSLRHKSSSSNTIKTVKVFIDGQEIKAVGYKKGGNVNDITSVTIPESIALGTHTLKLVVIDDKGVSDSKSVQIELIDSDIMPPYLVDNKVQIEEQKDGTYRIAVLFGDESSTVKEGSINQNGITLKSFSNTSVVSFTVSDLKSPVTRTATDSANNKGSGTITLTNYKIKKIESAVTSDSNPTNPTPDPKPQPAPIPDKPIEPAPTIVTGGEIPVL